MDASRSAEIDVSWRCVDCAPRVSLHLLLVQLCVRICKSGSVVGVGRWLANCFVRAQWRGSQPAPLSPDSYLVDPASSHMLVSKTKPCMSKYKCFYTVKLRMAH